MIYLVHVCSTISTIHSELSTGVADDGYRDGNKYDCSQRAQSSVHFADTTSVGYKLTGRISMCALHGTVGGEDYESSC
jgi:hypothetical protein